MRKAPPREKVLRGNAVVGDAHRETGGGTTVRAVAVVMSAADAAHTTENRIAEEARSAR